MKRRTRKRLSYQRTIILGFTVLYFICMLFSTYLVKENYVKSYEEYLSNKVVSLRSSIYDSYFQKFDEEGNLNENYINEITRAFSAGPESEDPYNQISAVLFGPDETIIARTTEYFSETEIRFRDGDNEHFDTVAMTVNSPYDYFTEEEIELIFSYLEEERKEQSKSNGIINSYELYLTYDWTTGEPLWLELSIRKMKQETFIDENGLENKKAELFDEGEIVWEWTNPNIDNVEEIIEDGTQVVSVSSSLGSEFSFPYLSNGQEYYDAWKNNKFLQLFDTADARYDGQYYYPASKKVDNNNCFAVYCIDLTDQKQLSSHEKVFYSSSFQSEYALQVKQTTYPWYAAINHMKYFYLYGFVLMLVCMLKTIHTTNKAYKKQEELEQIRRDFTNAAAHELKTPLAIVRNIMENMERETSEEKNTYYRQEAIHQTEVMDGLVQEMIFISKMDADKIESKKEPVSVTELIEEQMTKLEPLTEAKNLQVQYWKEEDYIINGDRSTLEKAIFNLLENAVSHNKPDGRISIHIEKNSCSIENTSNPIPEENLPHLCDMFFTGDKSRHSDHKGLGLYLAKRIFDMHGMGLDIENTDVGVKVTIR